MYEWIQIVSIRESSLKQQCQTSLWFYWTSSFCKTVEEWSIHLYFKIHFQMILPKTSLFTTAFLFNISSDVITLLNEILSTISFTILYLHVFCHVNIQISFFYDFSGKIKFSPNQHCTIEIQWEPHNFSNATLKK